MATQISSPVPESTARKSVDDKAKDILVEHGRDVGKGRLAKPEQVDTNAIMWSYLVPVAVFHLLIPLAFFTYLFSWWGVLFLFVGNYIFTSIGIGAGYHRLLTHKGFTCPKWLEYTMVTLGVCSFQDSPTRWVLVHRLHHQHSDHQEDPHSPKVSEFWAHMGWMFVDNKATSTASAYDRYVKDLMRDKYYMWLTRGHKWILVYALHALAFIPLGMLIGTFTGDMLRTTAQVFFWGVIMRTIFTWHVTWAINSAAHSWGYRNYETREDSRNNWLFALLTNGEGWHNNHHADPRSARHGHRWWEIDLTYLTLAGLQKVGLISDLVTPNHSALDRKSTD